MPTLLFAIAWFALALVVHVVWWRVAPPRRRTAALLKLLLAALPVGLVAAWFVPPPAGPIVGDVWDVYLIAQFHLACSLAYTCIHSAIQEDSPALMVVTFVAASGPNGCTREELLAALDDDLMIHPRLRDFQLAGMIEPADGRFVLTPAGHRFRRGFETVRRIFRLPRGG